MDREDKKCSCAKSARRKNIMLQLIRKKKRTRLCHCLRKNCLLKDAQEGMAKGKKVRGKRGYQIIDNIMINGLCEEMERKTEKRVEWRC